MGTAYYIEKDGMVFLVRRREMLTFPTSRDEIPFPFAEVREMPLPGRRIVFCTPRMKEYPHHWVHKDAIPGMADVDRIVQLAINRSLVRHVSDAIITKGGRVLVVKPLRGFGKGSWDIPGGYISYGESPEESLIREVKEETGLEVRISRLLLMDAKVIGEFYYLALIYVAEVAGGQISPDPAEIAEVAWLPVEEAAAAVGKVFAKEALEAYREQLRRSGS